jgi:hypothetical protein
MRFLHILHFTDINIESQAEKGLVIFEELLTEKSQAFGPVIHPTVLSYPCTKSRAEVDIISDAVHTSSSVENMTWFSMVLCLCKHRSAMKFLLNIYSEYFTFLLFSLTLYLTNHTADYWNSFNER